MAAFVRRDFVTARSYRLPFLLNLATSLFVLVVLYEGGKLIDRAPHPAEADLGRGYFTFVVVGLSVLQAVYVALNAFAAKLREEQTTGTLEALLASPIPPSIAILGSAAYELIQATVSAVLVLLIGAATDAHFTLRPVGLFTAVVTGLALMVSFAALGVGLAAFTVVFKRGGTFAALIGSGLSLLGGAYFPVSLLPGWLQAIGHALPFTWGIDALRQALIFGRSDAPHTLGLIATAVIALPLALWVFRLAVDAARRDGSLAQY